MSLIFALDLLDLGSLDRNFSDTNIDMLYIYIYIYIYIFLPSNYFVVGFRDLCKMTPRHILRKVLKRCPEEVFKTCLKGVFKTFLQDVQEINKCWLGKKKYQQRYYTILASDIDPEQIELQRNKYQQHYYTLFESNTNREQIIIPENNYKRFYNTFSDS